MRISFRVVEVFKTSTSLPPEQGQGHISVGGSTCLLPAGLATRPNMNRRLVEHEQAARGPTPQESFFLGCATCAISRHIAKPKRSHTVPWRYRRVATCRLGPSAEMRGAGSTSLGLLMMSRHRSSSPSSSSSSSSPSSASGSYCACNKGLNLRLWVISARTILTHRSKWCVRFCPLTFIRDFVEPVEVLVILVVTLDPVETVVVVVT